MKKFLLSALLCGACGIAMAQTTVTDSLLHDGLWRTYIIYVPASYSAANPPPLVLNFHGLGSNAAEQMAYSNFMPVADTAGFILVCPQGTNEIGANYWNVGFGGTADDLGFVDTLISRMISQYGVNPARVYATGMSNGGYMSYILASELGNRIAAIASVAGTMTPGKFAAASPPRAIPVMQIHGTADATVPYAGNANGVHIDSLVKFWVDNAGCSPTPAITPLPNTSTTDNSTATHYVWSGGTAGATVEFYKITNGAHTWPGAFNFGATTNQDFSASREIWRFFSQYTTSGALGVRDADPAPAHTGSVYPNPVTDILHLPEAAPARLVQVYDAAGRLVATLPQSQDGAVRTDKLPAGSYRACFQTKKGGMAFLPFIKR